jgi:hypothetical protein
MWPTDDSTYDPMHELRVWTDPTAITVTNPSSATVREWVRVAN